QPLQVAGELYRLAAQRSHAGAAEDFQRYTQWRQRQDRWVGELPAVRPGGGNEFRTHLESRGLVVAPPAGEAGQHGTGVARVHEGAADGARSAVEEFVAAPDR